MTDVDKLKGESFVIKALCDHEVALADIPFKLPWEKSKATDYVSTVAEWVDFLVQHPGCVREAEKDVSRLLCEASHVFGMEDALRNSEELRLARNSLQHQLGRLAKLGFVWNDDVMLNFVKHQLNESNRLMANQQQVVAQRMAEGLGHFLRLSPEIQLWAESSKEVEVRAVYDYGVVLRPRLWGGYRTVPEYCQMLRNWCDFLRKHPDCSSLYIVGYKSFLKDALVFVKEQKQNGANCAEIAELKDAVEKGWRALPSRVRMRRWISDTKSFF